MGKYAKAIVAVVGAGAGALLAIVAPHTALWDVAEVIVAMATAAGVYLVPNQTATAR
jgi:hypothetical protein